MNQKSGSVSIGILCFCAIIAKHLIIGPQFMVSLNANAAWIEITLKCVLAGLFLAFFLWLYKPLFPKSGSELFRDALGPVFGEIVSLIYAFCFIFLNAGLFRILVDALDTVMAVNAPHEFFSVFIISAIFFASYLGIRASGNLCTITFPFIVITLIVVCLILLPQYRFDNLMPILGNGAKPLLAGIFTKHFSFTELVLFIFLAPKLGTFRELKRAGILTIIFTAVFTILFTLAYCLTIPHPASEKFFLPLYQMTRMIKAGTFLQRLEPLAVFVWTSCIMCSMSILSSVSASLLTKENSTRKNGFVPIVTIITFLLAMLPKSEITAFRIYEKMIDFGYILYPVLPLFIVLVARIRRKMPR